MLKYVLITAYNVMNLIRRTDKIEFCHLRPSRHKLNKSFLLSFSIDGDWWILSESSVSMESISWQNEIDGSCMKEVVNINRFLFLTTKKFSKEDTKLKNKNSPTIWQDQKIDYVNIFALTTGVIYVH